MPFRYLFFILISFLSPTSSAEGNQQSPINGLAYLQASRLVEVEPGRRLNLYCICEGSPTVIFESGLTEPINNWAWVQPTIARSNKSCAYDRAGVGFSDPISRPSTSVNLVNDLHKLLQAAKINPPYFPSPFLLPTPQIPIIFP